MTQEQVDTLISKWQGRIASATENLLALDDTTTLKRIEGRDGFTALQLTGVTAARVLPAVGTMRELFNQLGTLSAIIEQATKLRRSLNRLWKYEETLTEIERLLTGPSITLPSLPTPLAQRSLVSASENKQAITPDRLLTAMMDAFQTARDAVLAVESAWGRLELALDAAKTKADTLQKQIEALELTNPPTLDEITSRITTLEACILTDPLGVEQDIDSQLSPLLSTARREIEEQRQKREQLRDSLEQARRQMRDITKRHVEVTTVFAACRECLGEVAELQQPQPEARLQELEQWLSSLETMARSKQWQSVPVGLERWRQAAAFLQETEQSAQAANQALRELPAELKGRLSALRVRAKAQGINDATLERLVLQADSLLREPPVPLDRLTKLIAACEVRLRR